MLQSSQRFEKVPQIDFEAKYRKAKAKLALLESSSTVSQPPQAPKPTQAKNKGLVAETYDWDEVEVSSDDDEVHISALMALSEDNKLAVGKSHARNGEWVNITMRKVNLLLSMDDDDDWKSYLDYINVDLKYVEEQRLNLFSKFNKLSFELNQCRDELLVLKQAKLESVTLQIQNSELVKQNQALQEELKKEKEIIWKWTQKNPKLYETLSLSPSPKKAGLGDDQLTEVSGESSHSTTFLLTNILSSKELAPKPSDWIERNNPDSKLPNFNTGRILEPESQAIKELLGVTDELSPTESITESKSDSPLPPLKQLQGAEPNSDLAPLVFQPHSPKEKLGLGRTILKRPTPAPTEHQKPSVRIEVKPESTDSKVDQLAELVRMLSEKIESTEKNSDSKSTKPSVSSGSSKPKTTPRPSGRCELCNYPNHSTDKCYRVLFCMICKQEDHRTCDHIPHTASLKARGLYKTQGYQYATPSKQRLKAKPFSPCPHCGFNDHLPDDCMMKDCCDICGDPSHETRGHDKVIQSRRKNQTNTSQSPEASTSTKCKTCGSSGHTTSDHDSLTEFKKSLRTKTTRKWVNKKN